MAKDLLIDSMPGGVQLSLVESKGGGPQKLVMRGQFARSDRATENKRLYRESLWRREFDRMSEDIKSRGVYGELDHPSDGRTKLTRVSHLITSLKVQGNEVIGEAEILDTPNGKIIRALAEAGARVGISSRGYGSTKTLADGTQEVQEDYHLDTFDFVADPATRTAIPKVYAEETKRVREAEMELTTEILKRDYPGIIEQLARELRLDSGRVNEDASSALTGADLVEAEQRTEQRLTERFSTQLRRAMEVVESEVRSELRSEMMSDPDVAAARAVVENIVALVRPFGLDAQAREEVEAGEAAVAKLKLELESKTLEVHRLQKESERDRGLMKELAYRLHLEKLLAGDPSREAIESIVGDVTKFESKDEITTKVEAIRKELDARGGPRKPKGDQVDGEKLAKAEEELAAAQERVSQLETEVSEARAEVEETKGQLERTRSTAEEALKISETLDAQLHAERRIAGHAGLSDEDRSTLRGLCEGVESQERADKIIEAFVPRRTPDNDETSRIRDRVRRGKGHDLTEEHNGGKGGRRSASPLREVGMNDGDFDRLAGTGAGRA